MSKRLLIGSKVPWRNMMTESGTPFLSYARIDGAKIGDELHRHLESLGVSVWFDAIAITPGKSQALQMDKGLQKARVGIALLTPASRRAILDRA